MPNSNNSIPCQEIIDLVIKCNTHFVLAAMEHSDPFAVCTNSTSFGAKRITTELYGQLFTTYDKKNTSATCADIMLNKNKMNGIASFVASSEAFWNSAYCDECYENATSLTQNFANETKNIFEMHDLLSVCIKNATTNHYNNSVLCDTCNADYQNLNNFYEHIKRTSLGKICFDLDDIVKKLKMNHQKLFRLILILFR